MQTALQNPHYKKIWEKVMMNKNPDAKSLEEALEMETKERYCQYMLTDNDNCIVDGDYISKYYHHNNNYEILGTAITLEDVLMLFGKIFNKTLNGFKFVQLTCEGAFITMKPSAHPLHRIEVILGKPLHEQTPETWEQISNLID